MAKNYNRHSGGGRFKRQDSSDLGLRAYKDQQDQIIDSLKLQQARSKEYRDEHYRDLRDAWNIDGPTEEFIRLYMATMINYATDLMKNGYTDPVSGKVSQYSPQDALKKSADWLEGFIEKTMNPNPATISSNRASQANKNKILFIKWLNKDPVKGKEYMKELKELDTEYNKKVAKFKTLLAKELRRTGF